MKKYAILKDIFEVENLSTRVAMCSKISYDKLLHALSKTNYSLRSELGLSHTTVSRYLRILFPDKPSSDGGKACNFLLAKYGYKQCKHCEEVFELDYFHKNAGRSDGLNAYCKPCQLELTSVTASSRTAKYRASKLLRSPRWVSQNELIAIRKFYAECPDGYQVDHIVPLQGELVSGLHVLSNLQYLTIADNCSKKNKFLPS